jgi:hypothetical protein
MNLTLAKAAPNWPLDSVAQRPSHSNRSIIFCAWASIFIWLPILPFTQQEQLLRHRVEQIYKSGDLRDMVAELSRHELSDFPPLYDPPPNRSLLNQSEALLKILEVIAAEPHADWVRAIYLRRFARTVYARFDDTEAKRVVTVLSRLPGGSSVLEELERDASNSFNSSLKRAIDENNEESKKEVFPRK